MGHPVDFIKIVSHLFLIPSDEHRDGWEHRPERGDGAGVQVPLGPQVQGVGGADGQRLSRGVDKGKADPQLGGGVEQGPGTEAEISGWTTFNL